MEIIFATVVASIIVAGGVVLCGAIRRDDERNRRDRFGDDEI